MSRVGAALVIFTLATPAWAADEGIVEASGEAQIKDGNEVEAKKAATLDAFRRAIEKVVGIYVESDFSATQRELVKNNQTDFYSKVQDKLVQKAKGFIKTYKVLSAKRTGDVYKVTLRAHVFESKVKAELKSLADLIAAAGNPKLMMVLQEVYVRNGKSKVSSAALIATSLQTKLMAMGFEFRGKAKAANTADDSLQAYDAWRADVGDISTMAREAGADILIEGRLEIKDLGAVTKEMAGGLDALVGMTKIEIHGAVRGLNTATGEVVATKPILYKEMGSDFDRALHRALRGSRGKGRAYNVIDKTFEKLLADAKTSFEKIAAQGQAYEIRLSNAKSFRKQGGPFIAALEGITGVSSVKQKSFGGGELILDVLCKCSTSELQNRIFSACEAKGGLVDIDLEGVSGKQLSFKL
jgi:hypothetical protein